MKRFYAHKGAEAVLSVISAILAVALIVLIRFVSRNRTVILTAGTAIAVMGVLLIFVYFPLYFSSVRYTLTETELLSERGVIIRRKSAIRLSSVQSYTMYIPRRAVLSGLSLVLLNVYGGTLALPFMKKSDIEELILHIEAESG
ncbi:MAG: hypothetical protein IJO99_06820 [Ruminococcus sp.]|nr:hypothetical protein [Ruminococcus sp.]